MPKIIMPILFGTAFALLSTLATAQIYTWKDAEGNTIFSDQPHPDAQAIDLPPTNVVQPTRQPAYQSNGYGQPEDGDTAEQASYTSLSIVSPADDESIRSNEGLLNLQVQIEPAMDAGHLLRAELDGQLVGPALPANGQTSATLSINNVDRGTHSLSAVVVNARGEVVQRSSSITVHLQRTSINQPGRQPTAPAPKPAP